MSRQQCCDASEIFSEIGPRRARSLAHPPRSFNALRHSGFPTCDTSQTCYAGSFSRRHPPCRALHASHSATRRTRRRCVEGPAAALSGRSHPSIFRSLTVVRAGGALRRARALTSFFARRPTHLPTSCRPSRRLRLRAASACSHPPLLSSRCRPASRCVCGGARTLWAWCAAAARSALPT